MSRNDKTVDKTVGNVDETPRGPARCASRAGMSSSPMGVAVDRNKSIPFIDTSPDYYYTESHNADNNMTVNDLVSIDRDKVMPVVTIDSMIKLIANRNVQ